MRLATLKLGEREVAAIRCRNHYFPLASINDRLGTDFPEAIFSLLEANRLEELRTWFDGGGEKKIPQRLSKEGIPCDRAVPRPLYRRPPKIWGIGLNYAAHAADLSEKPPTLAPASFMKPYTAVIGPGDDIRIPPQSNRTTAEAELGIVIGQSCKNVAEENWLSVVAGFTCVIDMTAEDILRQNPRYLTLSKSFDTFFSFGPELVTADEIDDLAALTVATIHNGKDYARNTVSNMTFAPGRLVSFHSAVMTLLAGDIISTGTPGAAVISHGDTVACRIDGFAPLVNPVVDLKMHRG
jgi:2-keto-4-pentenoate hydratase/2-oxohepta-3-ene-1,7-dioic acid hydratase in catechol pathway